MIYLFCFVCISVDTVTERKKHQFNYIESINSLGVVHPTCSGSLCKGGMMMEAMAAFHQLAS